MREQVHDDERVMTVVEHALALPQAQRQEFLKQTCADDPVLLRLASEYIDSEERMNGFLLEPMPFRLDHAEHRLRPGDILADRFRIVREIAQGGMGVVYEAIDEHLERRIALKCAKTGFAKRLRPEVRNASEIGHPNVCKIYEIHSTQTPYGPTDFITMEFLDGETLATRLRRGPLPRAQARDMALQLCSGLAEAHRKGVIHGDLKPTNVILVAEGKGGTRAVITDFGLARNAAAFMSEASSSVPGGTPGYMAPELLRGEKPSVASDIYALGKIMSEMLGPHKIEDTLGYASQIDSPVTRPYTLDRQTSGPESVASEEPPKGNLLSLHSKWDRVLLQCLAVDPSERFRTADELVAALTPPRVRRWVLLSALVALFAAVCELVWWQTRPDSRDSSRPLLRQLTAGDIDTSVSLSPDGRRVVYSSDRSGSLNLWLQDLSGGEPVRLTSDTSSETAGVFSPDGKSVAFRSEREGGGVYVTAVSASPVLTNNARRLIGAGGRDPRYSPDGKWIAYWQGLPSEGDTLRAGSARTFLVSSEGGSPRQVGSDLINADHPIFSPDGRQLLVSGQVPDRSERSYAIVNVATGRSREITVAKDLQARGFPRPSIEAWTSSGIFFGAVHGDEMNICYAATSPDLKLVAAPYILASSTSETVHVSITGRKLAFFNGVRQNKVWLQPVDTNSGRVSGQARRVVSPRPGVAAHPYLSPDGRRLLFRVVSTHGIDLVLRDLESGDERVISHRDEPELAGRFLLDNATILFESGVSGNADIRKWEVSSGAQSEFAQHASALGTSADGQWLSYWVRRRNGSNSIFVSRPATKQVAEIVSDNHSQLYVPHFSPDGRWISFIARNGPEQSRIFIAPFRGLAPVSSSEWIPISEGRSMDDKPEWSPNGALLYFVSDRDGYRCIWARRLTPSSKRPFGAPIPIQHFHELRSSMQNVNLGYQALSVASDKLAFLLSEQNGGIWVGDLPPAIH